MTRRARLLQVGAALFTLINVGGAGFAAAGAEFWHAAVHVVLGVVGAILTWRLTTTAGSIDQHLLPSADDRLETLQQSIDAVAVEVERLGEAQRFAAKLRGEDLEKRR